MSRLFQMLREAVQTFAAARAASEALSQHRMPGAPTLARLNISATEIAGLRI